MTFEVEAVLFDIDGTLVDSTPVVERAWRAWAAEHDLDAQSILRVCHGRRTEDTLAMFISEGIAEAAAKLEALESSDLDGVVPLPGARELLTSLPPTRWAAVTSGGRELMRARLAASGLPIPNVLIAAEDVTIGKPDPEGYAKAADRLGFDVSRCLVVEDAPAGIEAGLAAGARVVAVSTSHDHADLAAATIVRDLSNVSISYDGEVLRVSLADEVVG